MNSTSSTPINPARRQNPRPIPEAVKYGVASLRRYQCACKGTSIAWCPCCQVALCAKCLRDGECGRCGVPVVTFAHLRENAA